MKRVLAGLTLLVAGMTTTAVAQDVAADRQGFQFNFAATPCSGLSCATEQNLSNAKAIDAIIYKRMVKIHDAFSEAFRGHLSRLWRREPSASETDTFQSFTVCDSFMSLESVEQGLALATDAEKANEFFSFMEMQVQKRSGDVAREVRRRFALGDAAPDATEFANLLVWERALVDWVEALS